MREKIKSNVYRKNSKIELKRTGHPDTSNVGAT